MSCDKDREPNGLFMAATLIHGNLILPGMSPAYEDLSSIIFLEILFLWQSISLLARSLFLPGRRPMSILISPDDYLMSPDVQNVVGGREP